MVTSAGGAVSSLPVEVRELQARVVAAEAMAAEQLARAERAEYREQAHQDHWALEIDKLRQAGWGEAEYLAQIRGLQQQVLKLSRELQRARGTETHSGGGTGE